MPLNIPFPAWLKPEVIPGLPVRWYGVMYVVAFGIAYLLFRRQVKERNFPMTEDDISGLFFAAIISIILGARIFSTLVYETSNFYFTHPWLIFWPFQNGRFTGLAGMSYHGGVIGGLIALIIWVKVRRFDFREIADMVAVCVPLGYTFGRLGNFINGELYGRVTAWPLGMVFPQAARIPANESWVPEIAAKAGIEITGAWVNLPRHPSQLYEALFEGVVLWALLWFFRNRKPFKGFLLGLYFLGYGFFRFFIEYFREPDEGLGYRIEFVKSTLSTAYSHPPFSFSIGQILCFAMILFGIVWMIIASRLPGRETIRVYPDAKKEVPDKTDADRERNKRRKLRKKLR
jgi:phosphatidylglycerol:prolipoprotein diacylglycerol transferase